MNRYFGKIIMTLATVSLTCPAQAELLKASHMKDVQAKLEELLTQNEPEDILLAFDIDLTLRMPVHKAAHMPNILKHKAVFKKFASDLTPEQKDVMLSLSTKSGGEKLVEATIPETLRALSDKGLKMIAFTASLTGPLGDISRGEVWRYEQLKKLGIDFSQSFQAFEDLKLDDIAAYRGNYPTFCKGILSSNGERGKDSKGSALISFIKKASITSKVILLVDDKKKNLEDVEISLKTYDPSILFIGIEYTAGSDSKEGEISEADFEAFWKPLADQAKEIAPAEKKDAA